MFLDATLTFNSALNTPQAVSATANSAAVVDVTGVGSGNAPTMIGGYNLSNTGLGDDYGIGDGLAVPYVLMNVTTAGTGAGTITVSLQSAPDNGSYAPGTYTTIYTSPAYVGTALTAGTVLLFQVPPSPFGPGTSAPRFYRLVYTVASTATASFLASIMINPEFSLKGMQFANNFQAA